MIRETIRACLVCTGIALWMAAPSADNGVASTTVQEPSPRVEFNPMRERERAIFNAALAQTQECAHNALYARIMSGVRNRGQLISFAKVVCHGPVDYVMRQAGTPEMTSDVVDVIVEHELEGLSE